LLGCSSEPSSDTGSGVQKDAGSHTDSNQERSGHDASVARDSGVPADDDAADDDAADDDAADDDAADDDSDDDALASPGSLRDASAGPSAGSDQDASSTNGAGCAEDADCEVPDVVPAGCAEGMCVEGVCRFVARDGDRDGFAAKRCQSQVVGIEIETGEDCEDGDPDVNPDGWDGPAFDGHPDGCDDGIDQDCNGIVDDGQLADNSTCMCAPQDTQACATTPTGQAIDFPVLDDRGRPTGECRLGSRECAPDGTWGPCTDAIAPVSESCDGLDNDCDGFTDEEAVDRPTWVCDADSDEHASPDAEGYEQCSPPTEPACPGTWLADPGLFDDCDDNDVDNFPGNPERCDGKDQDCDELVDEQGTVEDGLKTHYYCDADNDGHLAANAQEVLACSEPTGCAGAWLANPLPTSFDDCDDASANRFPGNTEICDDIDNDCDMLVDEIGTTENGLKTAWHCDADGDTHLVPASPAVLSCSTPTGCSGDWIANPNPAFLDDCDDTSANRFPGNTEICDDIDNDCDLLVDEVGTAENQLKGTYYQDLDGDGFGTTASAVQACAPPGPEWIDVGGDCSDDVLADPDAADIHPGATEICNGKDDDCDTDIDALDTPFESPPSGPGATYECQGALGWQITACTADTLNCDTNIINGCETDGTSVAACRDCNTACSFSCGASGCVELVSISAGNAHTCAIDEAGKLHCWGRNVEGRLGFDTSGQPSLFAGVIPSLSGVSLVGPGNLHTCAIAGSTGYCWGSDANGQLGNGSPGASISPVALSLSSVTSIDAGYAHTCAVAGGNVMCWGLGTEGRIGDLDLTAHSEISPQPAIRTADFEAIADGVKVVTGEKHSCVLTQGDTVECWGDDEYGELGDGSNTDSGSSVDVGLSNVTDLAAGALHTCAIAGGQVYCWGRNSAQQTGQATGTSYNTPQAVSGFTSATQVVAGTSFTCVLSGGRVSCWGANDLGQRGDASATETATPTTLSLTQVVQITAGAAHACALTQNNEAYCWGANAYGQLGDGSFNNNANPTPRLVAAP
jgi:alpha-tubulin suppressor-like RCC1 family protein